MAIDCWGDTLLNVMEYQRQPGEINLTETALLPDPTVSGPQTVLWGTGRKRGRRSVSGWATQLDFDLMEADFYSFNHRRLELRDGTVWRAVIESLQAESKIGSDYVFYSATFVEA